MSFTDEIREMFNDNVLMGKKAIVCDIKIELLKRPEDTITNKELFILLDKIIEKEENKNIK